jgi:hypothetical protein
MNRTLIYLSLIKILFLTTRSNALDGLCLIDLTQKTVRPICRRPLPPRPVEETEFPDPLTTPLSNNDWNTFSDLNVPERPSTPTSFNNSQNEECGESSTISSFLIKFNPINLSSKQSLMLPPLNLGMVLSKEPGSRKRIMNKNWNLLSQKKSIPLHVLMILRTSLNRQVSYEKRAEYKNMIDKKVQEHES